MLAKSEQHRELEHDQLRPRQEHELRKQVRMDQEKLQKEE
jgi:hypothetical protein